MTIYTTFPGSGGEFFFKVFTIYGHSCHINHVTWAVWIKFHSLHPYRLYIKYGYNGPSDFRGDALNLQNMRNLSQRSKNDLDLLYSQIFMNSFRKLSIPIFKSKSSKLSLKYMFKHFSIFDLAIKKVKVNQRSPFV